MMNIPFKIESVDSEKAILKSLSWIGPKDTKKLQKNENVNVWSSSSIYVPFVMSFSPDVYQFMYNGHTYFTDSLEKAQKMAVDLVKTELELEEKWLKKGIGFGRL